MTDTPSPSSINNIRISKPSMQAVPTPGMGEAAKNAVSKVKVATEPKIVNISAPPAIEAPPEEVDLSDDAPEVKSVSAERHERWKAQQAEKKEQRELARLEREAKQQSLAAPLLQKGDLIGAAKALGIAPADLVSLVNNSVLGIQKQEEKPLSPEEQRAADEAKFRAERLAFEEEQKAWRFNKTAADYIEKNIAPELKDQDKYECLHQFTDLNQTMSTVYDYMNKHYSETCSYDSEGKLSKQGEVLSVKDVLETMEEEMSNSIAASLEKNKKLKKFKQFFGSEEKKEAEELSNDQLDDKALKAKFRNPSPSNDIAPWQFSPEEEIEEEEVPDLALSQEKPMLLQSTVSNNKVLSPGQRPPNWFGLSRAEQLDIIRREDEAAARQKRLNRKR